MPRACRVGDGLQIGGKVEPDIGRDVKPQKGCGDVGLAMSWPGFVSFSYWSILKVVASYWVRQIEQRYKKSREVVDGMFPCNRLTLRPFGTLQRFREGLRDFVAEFPGCST